MKKVLIATGLFCTLVLSGQKLNLKEVKEFIENKESENNYEELVKAFVDNPAVFISDTLKIRNLYYGKLFYEEQIKHKNTKLEYLKLVKLTSKKKYEKAIKLGEIILENDPVNLSVLMNLKTCYENMQDENEREKKIDRQINILMKAIAQYGNGRDADNALKVISKGDEYVLLIYMGINMPRYKVTFETLNDGTVIDTWTKEASYKSDSRNKVYVKILKKKSQGIE